MMSLKMARANSRRSFSRFDWHHINIKNERFDQISQFSELVGFLYSADNLIHSRDSGTLLEDCERFEKKTDDIDANELVLECTRFSCVLKDNALITSASDMLHYLYVNDLHDISQSHFAFSWLCLSLATAERSFGKLKLIKTFKKSNGSSMKGRETLRPGLWFPLKVTRLGGLTYDWRDKFLRYQQSQKKHCSGELATEVAYLPACFARFSLCAHNLFPLLLVMLYLRVSSKYCDFHYPLISFVIIIKVMTG